MGDAVEREAKLDADVTFRLPAMDGARTGTTVTALPVAWLDAVYFDTPDLRLLAAGITLRHRQERSASEPDRSEWTLKLPPLGRSAKDGEAVVRRELTWAGEPGRMPDEALHLVGGHRRHAPLEEVARLVTQRQRLQLRDEQGSLLAELDDDMVSLLDGARLAHRFREIEVELAAGVPEEVLGPILARLRAAGARAGTGQPKLERALAARTAAGTSARSPRAAAAADRVPDPVDRRATIEQLVTATIGDGYGRLLDHDPGVRLYEDPEDVHRARVATRRLRSDLRTLRPLLDGAWLEEVSPELAWLADALGAVRDADVLGERLRQNGTALGGDDARRARVLVTQLLGQRNLAVERLTGALDSDRYATLLDGLEAAVASPPLAAGSAATVGGSAFAPTDAARRVLPDLVAKPWRQLRRVVVALDAEPGDQDLHRVRIRAKRLRYACEAAGPVMGRPAVRMGRAAADLQEVLGDLHDAAVARQWLRDAARRADPGVALAAGMLMAAERMEAARCRAAWPDAWARLRRPKLRAWLD